MEKPRFELRLLDSKSSELTNYSIPPQVYEYHKSLSPELFQKKFPKTKNNNFFVDFLKSFKVPKPFWALFPKKC